MRSASWKVSIYDIAAAWPECYQGPLTEAVQGAGLGWVPTLRGSGVLASGKHEVSFFFVQLEAEYTLSSWETFKKAGGKK